MKNNEFIDLVYKENGLIFREMLEWRHKIMLRYFVSIGVLGFAIQWLYSNPETRNYLFVVFVLASGLSVLCRYLDAANHTALTDCMAVGKAIEEEALGSEGAIGYYSESGGADYLEKGIRFTTVFRWFYSILAIVWLLMAVYSYFLWGN